MTTRVRLTYQDYVALPDDGRRYELHEGELSVTPAPGVSHQDTLGNLYVILGGHARNITIGQPDLVLVESARLTLLSERGLEGATLAVEVISPSSTLIDRRRKLR